VNISNLLGYEIDIKEVCRGVKKKNKNVIVIVDATQSVPHARLDVKNINIDFFVCSGYKMGAATGTGLAYIKSKWLNQIKPIRFGGSMNNQIHPTNFTYAALP
jgi:cysteine desulfurase/selenocysteine lyase